MGGGGCIWGCVVGPVVDYPFDVVRIGDFGAELQRLGAEPEGGCYFGLVGSDEDVDTLA